MDFKPKPYQELGIDWLLEHPEAAALFAGMGLGKSVMTLAAIQEMMVEGQSRGALIIAPNRVSTWTWPREIKKWNQFNWMKIALLRTPEGIQAWHDGSADIYLLNFERIPQFVKACMVGRRKTQMPVDHLIIDELSKAKSPKSKRINLLLQYAEHFKYRWGLTGTPRPAGYKDLFAPIRLLDGGKRLGKVYSAFEGAYLEPDNPRSEHPKWIDKPGTAEKIDAKLADMALVLRSEDYLDIPPTVVIDVDVPLPAKALKAYKEMEKEFLTQLDRNEIVAVNLGVRVFKLLQITSGAVYDENKDVGFVHDAKIKALMKVRKQHPNEPILVATSFKHENARIMEAFPEAEMFQDDSIERWNAGKIKMLVAHPLSIGHGVDGLQDGGRIIVWFSPTYSPDGYDQYNARLGRMGQKHETLIYRLLCPGTIDDAAVEAIRERAEGQSGTLSCIKNLQDLARARKNKS
jgi:hypothetical protein